MISCNKMQHTVTLNITKEKKMSSQQTQEEAYQHHLISDFSNLVLEMGANAVLHYVSAEAKEELEMAFQNHQKQGDKLFDKIIERDA